MSLVFFDTNLFVYWMEDHPEFAPKVEHIRQRMIERKDRLCTSALTVGELLAAPYAANNEVLASRYKALLRPPLLEVLPFTAETSDRYARIRAGRNVRPADAIQLACAAQAGVDLFLTNDRRLSQVTVPGIQFIADLDMRLV